MKKIIAAMCVATAVVSGCAYVPFAREAKKKPREAGVIALKLDHRPEDQQKAQALMAANCGNGNVKVLEEGEVVIGEKSSSTANKTNETMRSGGLGLGSGFSLGGSDRPGERVSAVSETTQMKEWQISYICEKRR